jgi:hypothetical protein
MYPCARLMKPNKTVIWTVAIVGGVAAAVLSVVNVGHWRPESITLQGAVIRHDGDTRREVPVAGAEVTASDGVATFTTQSDSSGFFKLTFRRRAWPDEWVSLNVQHAAYQPFDLKIQASLRPSSRKLYIATLDPIASEQGPSGTLSAVSNVRIRYTVNVQSEANIGTAIKTFQVNNRGNLPCNRPGPCSPGGEWAASSDSTTLDAGADNEFRSVRVSCIAGPCPFTRIDTSGFSQGGRTIVASALDWSDTATFLVEAEVYRRSNDSSVRESYPIIYGSVLHFTLPTDAEGVSIEAEIDGSPMVFPLGPDLFLSWATCNSKNGTRSENSTAYECELKPGYHF